MKRLVFLAGFLSLALLTNLSFRVPTTVEAQAVCLTGTAPAFTFGTQKNVPLPGGGVLPDGDLFYLGANGLQFTTQSPGASFFTITPNSNANFGSYPGYPNTTSLGFVATTPNAISTAVSCLDSIWDINFEVAGTGATAGDVITLYFQQPDGSGRRTLVQLTVQADNNSARVTGLLAGATLDAVGHSPTTIGTLLPYEEAAGTAGNRTRLITLALPMNGTIPDCNQLVVEVNRAGGSGRTTVALINIVVTRNATTTATGTGIQTGQQGTYPTAARCANVCPACPTISCDLTICFADACTWCNRLDFASYRRDYWVSIPNYNMGLMVSPYGFNGILVRQALGCSGFTRNDPYSKMVAEYVAAQLSVQHALPFWYPQLSKQKLACHVRVPMAMPGMPAPASSLPATLSNGVVLDGNSSLQDLFTATNWAALKGNTSDHQKLLAIYMQLNNCKKD
ncbi:MAG: hypothetical protein JST84_12080 [Acidobacteria bacterium]|nr:hypothetical protein [Acidobacteriota bacterium]